MTAAAAASAAATATPSPRRGCTRRGSDLHGFDEGTTPGGDREGPGRRVERRTKAAAALEAATTEEAESRGLQRPDEGT